MVSAKVKLTNAQGMHMRPAQVFVNTITAYPCNVTILYNERVINAREHNESHGGVHKVRQRDRDTVLRRKGAGVLGRGGGAYRIRLR